MLAWPWGVKYIIDPASNLVTSHIESWDIEPWEVSSGCNLLHQLCDHAAHVSCIQ